MNCTEAAEFVVGAGGSGGFDAAERLLDPLDGGECAVVGHGAAIESRVPPGKA